LQAFANKWRSKRVVFALPPFN
jgi:hypothetical protein